MPRPRLSDDDVRRALESLPGWTVEDGQLRRTYQFPDFVEAFAFMTACALRIQEMDHHPEWSNVYGTVRVALVTHDAGGISARDVELAGRMEALADRRPR
jgi:4a-hydroxytetrahydrobiopterin dehydratase